MNNLFFQKLFFFRVISERRVRGSQIDAVYFRLDFRLFSVILVFDILWQLFLRI